MRCAQDFLFQAEDSIRDVGVTGVQTCALPISRSATSTSRHPPLIVPVLAPPSQTSIRAPGRRYEDPSTLTTVASALRSRLDIAASNASTKALTSFISSPRSTAACPA